MLLEIQERQIQPDIVVVELSGKLALGRESQRVEGLLHDLVNSGCKRLILEMTGVNYIDSAGVGLLALASGKMHESGGKVILVAPAGRVLDVLKMTQLNRLVTVCASEDEAVAALGKTAPPATA